MGGGGGGANFDTLMVIPVSGLPPAQLWGMGSAVNSSIGVWGCAPEANAF